MKINLRYKTEYSSNKAIKYIFFLLNPVVGLLLSIRTIQTKSSFIILGLFNLLFGFCFTINMDSGFDSIRYVEDFTKVSNYSLTNYLEEFNKFIGGDKYISDYYLETISFIVSRFTNNYHYLFLALSIVFTFFMIKSLRYLVLHEDFKINNFYFISLLILFCMNNIFNINGARFWTLTWIVVFLYFKIIVEGKWIYFASFLILPIVHSASYIFLILLILMFFFKNVSFYSKSIFIASIPLALISLKINSDFINFFPEAVQHKVNNYGDSEKIAERLQEMNILSVFLKYLKFIYFNILILFILKKAKEIRLVNSLLIIAVFCNITYFIPSVGGRFIYFLYVIISFILLYNYKSFYKYKLLIYFIPIVLLLDIYGFIINTFKILNPLFYFSPPFYSIIEIISK